MFCDEVTIHFIAGPGGNGSIAFRREKFIPRGGPSGGDGGDGGSIYLEANENINTLAEFNTHKVFRAKAGERGFGKEMGGADAEDLILHVPVGTMVFDACPPTCPPKLEERRWKSRKTSGRRRDEKMGILMGDLSNHGERFKVARGGRGGFGNAHFKSSTRQAPTFAELGEPGEEKKCVLELKLVADVGFIGLPSVGKSTLLSRVSHARPKIADYPFTTLVPNLGLVTMQQFGGSIRQNFLACDLPGLIEGAHKGKGLGIKFLKHVVRNRVLVHLIDVNSLDPVKDYRIIRKELRAFDRKLGSKPEIVVFNKIDTLSQENLSTLITNFKKKQHHIKKPFAISCVTGEGIKPLLFEVWKLLEREKKEEPKPVSQEQFKVFRPQPEYYEHAFKVKVLKKRKQGSVFEVTGRRIEQIVVMTDFRNPEAVSRVYDVFEKMGINKELRRAGAKFRDEVRIGEAKIVYRWE